QKEAVYKCCIRTIIEYANIIFFNTTVTNIVKLESLQRKAALICLGAHPRSSTSKMMLELNWNSLKQRSVYAALVLMFKLLNKFLPEYLCSLVTIKPLSNILMTRSGNSIKTAVILPVCKTAGYSKSIISLTCKLWNELPYDITNCRNLFIFKNRLNFLLNCNCRNVQLCYYSNLHEGKLGRNLTNMRLGLSLLNFHLYTNNLSDNPFCQHCLDIVESTEHYLFLCPAYGNSRIKLVTELQNLVNKLQLEDGSAIRFNRKFVKLANVILPTGRSNPVIFFPNLTKLCLCGLNELVFLNNSYDEICSVQHKLYTCVIDFMYTSRRFIT